MPLSIQELRRKRDAKAREARAVLDAAGANFTAADAAKINDIYSEIDRIDLQLNAARQQLDLESSLDLPDDESRGRVYSTGRKADRERSGLAERDHAIFSKWIRSGDRGLNAEDMDYIRSRPRADQSTTPGTAGGYTVPRDFVAVLLERLAAFGGIRSIAQVVPTSGGNPMDWPTVDETSETGEIVAEGQPASDGDITFGTVNLGAYKYSSKVIRVSIELLINSAIDLVGYITKALATRIARITSTHFVTGTGTNQPNGWTTPALTVAQGAAGDILYSDLTALEHAVDPAYRVSPSVRWAFHDSTLRALKEVVDSTGRPLWIPGLSASFATPVPDTLLGYRYSIQQEMATMADAVGSKVIGFGDFSKYVIRDVMAATLFRFEDSAFMINGQVGFLSWSRHDGDRIDVNYDAIKVLTKA